MLIMMIKLKSVSCPSAEDKEGFNFMLRICTKVRISLIAHHTSHLMINFLRKE